MSFKNLGQVFNTLSSDAHGITDLFSIFNTLGHKSMYGLSEMVNVFKEAGEIEKGISAFNKTQTIFESLGSSSEQINALKDAFEGLSEKSVFAILGMSNLSEAEIEATLRALGLAAGEEAATAATIASGSAATGASAAFKGLGASILTAAEGLMTFLFTNPVGWMILAAGAAFGLAKAYDALTISYTEANEAASESRTTYENTQSELDSLDSKLKTTKDRIDELQTQKTLSLTDEEELKNLQVQNNQLQQQYDIKKRIAEIQLKDAGEKALSALTNTNTGYYTTEQTSWTSPVGNTLISTESKQVNKIDEVIDKQKRLNDITSKRESLLKQQENIESDSVSGLGSYIDKHNELKNVKSQLAQLDKEEADLTNDISNTLPEIQANYESFINSGISGGEEIKSKYEEMMNVMTSASDVEASINTLFSEQRFDGVKENLVSAAKDSSSAFEDVFNNTVGLNDELERLGISADDFKQSIFAIANEGLPDVEKESNIIRDNFMSGSYDAWQIADRKKDINKFLKGKSEDDIDTFYNYIKSNGIDISQWNTEDLEYNFKISMEGADEAANSVEGLKTNLKAAMDTVTNLNTAMTEANSASGLSLDSITNLETTFKGYDTSMLFERTANGVRLNIDAMRELNEQYANGQADNYRKKIEELSNQLTKEKEKLLEINPSNTEDYVGQIDVIQSIRDQIAETENYAAAWQGVTSAYNEYVNAQSAGNNRDSLQGVAKDKDTIKNTIDEGWGNSADVQAYLDLVLGTDRPQKASEAWEKLNADIGDTGHSLSDYMDVDDKGNLQAENVKMWFTDIADVAGKGFTKIADDGSMSLDLTGDKLDALAEKFHTSTSFITLMAQALEDMGVDVDWGNIEAGADVVAENVAKVSLSVDEAKAKLSELQNVGSISDKIDLDFDIGTASISELENQIKSLKSIKINADVDPAGAAAVEKLIQETEKEYYIKINTETGGQLDDAIEKVTSIQNKIEEAKKNAGDNFDIKATVDGDDEIKNFAKELANMDKEARIAVGIEVKDGDVQGVLDQLKTKPESIQVPVNYTTGEVEDYQPEDKEATVNFGKNSIIPDVYKPKDKNAMVTFFKDSTRPDGYKPEDKDAYVNFHVRVLGSVPSGGGGVDGTAHARGTAFKSGYWGTKESGFALGGEEGQEILVRDGHWYTIGENSAEFFGYKKGDIIFNAEQSKQILEKGKITHGKKRGTSLATGTAFSDGTAFARGSKSKKKSSKNKEDKALQSFQDWIAKLFDWIEIRVKRQTERIDRFTKRADNALKSERYSSASSNYRKAVNATATQIEYEQTASNKYQAEANKILNRAVKKGLVSRSKANGIKSKVANGTLNIAEYGERMREVIKDYQTWAEKAIDAKNAIEDLHGKIRDYIQDLKDVREAQRKARIERYETYEKIATSTYTSDAGSYYKLNNGQLSYQNSVLQNTNRAYAAEVSGISSDNKKIQKQASKAVNGLLNQNTSKAISSKTTKKQREKLKSYNKALEQAQQCIRSNKPIPDSVLSKIKKQSINVYERLYAYNLSLDNLETARLEQATVYATNSTEFFENISKQYEKVDSANKNKMDLNKKKSGNAATAKEANKYLNKVASGYDNIIKYDNAEIKKYNKYLTKSSGKILSGKVVTGRFSNLSAKKQKEAVRIINDAKAKVQRGVTISTDTLSGLARLYSEGYVSGSFYNACITYNNALEHKRQAEAQKEIDEQTRIQERDAIAAEKFANIEQEYNNLEDNINSKRSLTNAKQTTKTTTGRSLNTNDYQKSINYNNESIVNYRKEISALSKALKSNSKLYAENSQKRHEDELKLNEYKVKLQELITKNEELTNSIIQIPYDRISDSLEKLDAIANYHKSISDLKTARSQDLDLADYLQQISDNDRKIAEYTKQREQLEIDLQAAKDNGGYYGGKSITDWRKELREAVTNINQIEIENEKLKDSLRDDVYWRDFERAHDAAQRLSDILSGMANLLSDDMFFDKNGDITEWGIDQIATLTKQFENARDEVENYSADIDNLNALYATGQYTQLEYTEKLGELQKKLLDSAKDMKTYLYSIKDMYKEMDKAELDALFKLIELRKEALSKKKSYYDYDRNIRSKTKDIQELQSQIAALEGVSDAASRAKRAKLQEELADKQEDLNDALFDHNIQLSQDALDDLKEILQTEFDDKWEDITQDLDKMQELLTAANDLTSANMSNVNASLDKLLSFYGINTGRTGVMDSYASGSKRITKTGRALTNENGDEIIVTDYGLIVPLKTGDGIVPADMTKKLYSMAMGVTPNIQTPRVQMPANLSNPNIEVHQHYDALINIEGSADAATVKDLERMSKQLLETSYQYTTNRIRQDNVRTGGLRRI